VGNMSSPAEDEFGETGGTLVKILGLGKSFIFNTSGKNLILKISPGDFPYVPFVFFQFMKYYFMTSLKVQLHESFIFYSLNMHYTET